MPTVELSTQFDCFIFDCDGVLWHDEEVIEGAIDLVNRLSEKKVFFVTNASKLSRKSVYEKFKRLGFSVDIDQVYPSGYFCADYLKTVYPEATGLYLIGGAGLAEELKCKGFNVHGINDSGDFSVDMFKESAEKDQIFDGVVVGFDSAFNYTKLCKASLALQKNPKAFLCSTNEDAYLKVGDFAMPGNGSMTAIVKYCMQTACTNKRDFIVTGKPHRNIVDFLLNKCGVSRDKCLMIGDRLDTDIQLAVNSSIKSCMVLTGCSKPSDIVADAPVPDYIVNSVADI